MVTESAPKLKLLTPCELESLDNILGQSVTLGIQPAVKRRTLRVVGRKTKFVKFRVIPISQLSPNTLCSVNMKKVGLILGGTRSVVTSDFAYRKQAKRVKEKTKIQ
jgi:hypothetical protein